MPKKLSVWLLMVILMFSLIYNYHQYRVIRSYNNKQYNIDNELKAQISSLALYLEQWDNEGKELDKEKYKEELIKKMNLTYITLIYSTYNHNQIVHDSFYMLQNLIYSRDNISKDEAHQISIVLKEIIKPKESAIDIEACKKLDNYILSISI